MDSDAIDTMDTMDAEKQRIAIAEACGWTGCILYNVESGKEPRGHPPKQQSCYQGYTELIHDYLNNLNAMHEAEEMLTNEHYAMYHIQLRMLTKNTEITSAFTTLHATAAQRAEAFLKTLNLWEP